MQLFETVVANLGSRFTLRLLPHRGRLFLSPLGHPLDLPVDLAVGVQIGEDYRILPFSDRYKAFPSLEQELLPSGVAYRCRDADLGVLVTIRFRSAFYPRDIIVSTAPFCYVSLEIARLPGSSAKPAALEGKVFLAVKPGSEFTLRRIDGGFAFSGTFRPGAAGHDLRLPRELRDGVPGEFGVAAVEPEPELGDRRVALPFALALDQESVRHEFALAGYCGADFFRVGRERYRFKYAGFFASLEEVLAFAASERGEIGQKMDRFDGVIGGGALPRDTEQLIALALQTYLANTFWMTRRGRDWFSVWEGTRRRNSPVSVEYHAAQLTFALWPELLEMLLEEWADHEQRSLYGSYLPRDMGTGMTADGRPAPHPTEVD